MTLSQTRFTRWFIAFGFALAVLGIVGLNTLAAQGRGKGRGGNGGGGGGGTSAGWADNFDSIGAARWVKAGAGTPVPGNSSQNIGTYDPNHVSIVQDTAGNKYLRIELTQAPGSGTSVISTGGLLYSAEKFGYGTYEWTMRMSSTSNDPGVVAGAVPGNVSAAFIYTNNSQTEIDFEFAGHVLSDSDNYNNETLYMANWNNKGPKSPPSNGELTSSTTNVPGINSQFKTYRFIWEQGRITYCVNGVYVTDHITNVPSSPANVMINHWGTNGGFGGTATTGITRYFYVDRVGYTPSLLGCGAPFPALP